MQRCHGLDESQPDATTPHRIASAFLMVTSHSKHNKHRGVDGCQMDDVDMSPVRSFKVQSPLSLGVYNPQLRIGSRIQTSREKYTASGDKKKPTSGSGVTCDALWDQCG